MKFKYFIALVVFFTVVGCSEKKQHPAVEANKHDLVLNEPEKDSLVFGNDIHDYILFGMFCAECGSHCATMFLYTTGGNAHTLLADYTDSYFNNNGNVICNTPITDIKKLHAAASIIGKIPARLLTTTHTRERFGYPDCNDGCGIYFEFGLAGKVKKFSIDTETSKLTEDMKVFSGFLQNIIGEMKK